MSLDIFSTHYLLAAIKEMVPQTSFLRDRYFPTNDATDLFSTNDVLVEFKDGNRKIAPFVAPRVGGITIDRDGYVMKSYEPPLIQPKRMLTIDQLNKRGFGEALLTQLTPAERQQTLILGDIDDLNSLITRREEVMAAEVLRTNKCIMNHYADDLTTVLDAKEIKFYDGDTNPATYTPDIDWDDTGAKIIDDLWAMWRSLATRGLPATDLIVAPDVATVMINDATIQNFLNNRRYELGIVDPIEEAYPGVSKICVLNVYGRNINVYCYSETYVGEDGNNTQFIPNNYAIMTAPAAGRTLYGAVTQVEEFDGEFHTYTGKRIPKYLSDAKKNTREIMVSACPVLLPKNKNPWIAAKVMGN